jgi:hypothetical protein
VNYCQPRDRQKESMLEKHSVKRLCLTIRDATAIGRIPIARPIPKSTAATTSAGLFFTDLSLFIILRGIPRPSGRGGIARRALARLVFPGSLLLFVVVLNVIAVAIGSLCDGAMLVRDALNGTV